MSDKPTADVESLDSLDVSVQDLATQVKGLNSQLKGKASRGGLWVALFAALLSAVTAIGGAVYVNKLRVDAAVGACERGNVLRANIVSFVADDLLGADDPDVPNGIEGPAEAQVVAITQGRFAPVDCTLID